MTGIRAFVGLNGSGKTLGMIDRIVIPAWRDGRTVVGNLDLDPTGVGCAPELYRPLTSAQELAEVSDCVVVLDEISACLPARLWASLGADLVRELQQLRKRDVVVAWTGPAWSNCEKVLRDVTQLVTLCRGSLPDRWVREDSIEWFPKALLDDDGRRIPASRDWPPNRLIRMASYAREDFDDFEAHRARSKLRARHRGIIWRPLCEAQRCYRTQQQVPLLDNLNDYGGTCLRCGGTRPARPKCACSKAAEGGALAPPVAAHGSGLR